VDARDEVLSFPPLINSAGLGRVVPGMDVLFVETTGTVLDQVLLATNILAANLQDRGGTIEPLVTRYPWDTPRGREVIAPHPLADRRSVELDLLAARRLLGEPELSLEEAERCLARVGVQVERRGPTRLAATTPPWRLDYLHPVDAVEDVAISRGYASFAPSMPAELTVGGLAPLTAWGDRLREALIGCGFEEAIGNILTSEPEVRARMNLGAEDGFPPLHGGALVRIDNVMNENYAVLRDWLVPTLLEVERRSSGATFPHRSFELGEAAVWDERENQGSRTELRLAALVSHDKAGFSELQAVLHELLRRAGLELAAGPTPAAGRYALVPCQHPSFIPGRATRVLAGGEELGVLGEVHPEVLTRCGVYFPAVAFELRVEPLARVTGAVA
jgi:phenylalanyl-tRNA synthetase beta chain